MTELNVFGKRPNLLEFWISELRIYAIKQLFARWTRASFATFTEERERANKKVIIIKEWTAGVTVC
jgi:hypothetical protein